jgi:hypothetical protein
MSFSWFGIIVTAPTEEIFARVKKLDSCAIALPNGFAAVETDEWTDWSEPGLTAKWSLEFKESWLLVAHSTSTIFVYEHSYNGEILRSLSFSGDVGWEIVEGTAEDWENILFTESQINIALDMSKDEPDNKQWLDELQSLKNKQLIQGNMLPVADPTLILFLTDKIGTEIM